MHDSETQHLNRCLLADINECDLDAPCDTNAYCNNTNGSYICICMEGYSGSGINCTGMNYIQLCFFIKHLIEVWPRSLLSGISAFNKSVGGLTSALSYANEKFALTIKLLYQAPSID